MTYGILRKRSVSSLRGRYVVGLSATCLGAIALLTFAPPAFAHHPFGGDMPTTALAGFLSGVGHPVIGIDHLAFVVAVGLIAAVVRNGWTVAIAFLLAAVTGTGIHLMNASLPAPELVISASVLLFGILAAVRRELNPQALVALVGFLGMFHGYAYGEAVVGAEPTPILAYLLGFTAVQTLIAFATYCVFRQGIKRHGSMQFVPLKMLAAAICGAGAVLLAGAV